MTALCRGAVRAWGWWEEDEENEEDEEDSQINDRFELEAVMEQIQHDKG